MDCLPGVNKKDFVRNDSFPVVREGILNDSEAAVEASLETDGAASDHSVPQPARNRGTVYVCPELACFGA